MAKVSHLVVIITTLSLLLVMFLKSTSVFAAPNHGPLRLDRHQVDSGWVNFEFAVFEGKLRIIGNPVQDQAIAPDHQWIWDANDAGRGCGVQCIEFLGVFPDGSTIDPEDGFDESSNFTDTGTITVGWTVDQLREGNVTAEWTGPGGSTRIDITNVRTAANFIENTDSHGGADTEGMSDQERLVAEQTPIIKALLLQEPDKLRFCLLGTPNFNSQTIDNISIDNLALLISFWLISRQFIIDSIRENGGHTLTYENDATGETLQLYLSEDTDNRLFLCLLSDDAYGQQLRDILNLNALEEGDRIALEGLDNPPENIDNCKGGTGLIDAFLGFIICPLVEGVLGVIHWAETNLIIPYLAINPLQSDTNDPNPVFVLWQAVRNMAYIFLIVGFMYLVFAETTSIGGEAYQLKRLAPRLVLVTIGITLSYYIVGLIIDFFNILGLGIAQITAWAITQTGATTLVTVQGGATALGLVGLIAGTGALALTTVLLSGSISAPAIAVAAITGIFIILGVIMTLLLRQILILALTIISPLAFVCALLPNTEKYTKMWWSYISKALVMYPLIMLLFAGGKIFGSIIHTDAFGTEGGALRSLMGFMANVAPLILVPFTFKMAGGVIGGFYGAMRGAVSKGYNATMGSEHNPDSIRGRRAETAGKVARGINRVASRAASGGRIARYSGAASFGKLVQRSARLSERAAIAEKQEAEKARAIMHDVDDAVHKQVVLGDEGISKEELMAQGLSDAEAQETIDAFDHKPTAGNEGAARGLRARWGVRKEAYSSFGAKHGGNTARVAQVRAALQRDVTNGTLSREQAGVLWTSFAKGAKEAGKGAALDNMRGADGSKSTAWDGDLTAASTSTATLKDHITDMHGGTDVERWSDHDWRMVGHAINNEELMQDEVYREKILNLAQKAADHAGQVPGREEPEILEPAEDGSGGGIAGRGYGLNLDKVGIMKRIAATTEGERVATGRASRPGVQGPDASTDQSGTDPRGYV